jgi:hypothetical protein
MCLCLLAPVAASARTTWIVRDASGSKAGTVSGPNDQGTYLIRHAGTLYAGIFEKGDGLWYAQNAGSADAGYFIRRSTSNPRWRLLNYFRTRLIGRVVRRGEQWVVQQRSNGEYLTKGRVEDSCPAWVAGGAVCWLVRGFPMN